jgi:hypothetical protein
VRIRTPRSIVPGVLSIATVFAATLLAQDGGAKRPAGAPPAAQGAPGTKDLGAGLAAALEKSPGCVGVELGLFQSGKLAIFAWFEDKAAAVAWVKSDYHQGAMAMLHAGAAAAGAKGGDGGKHDAAEEPQREPLQWVPDDVGPILCIASITPSTEQRVPGFPTPIGQISIELYSPLPGGASFGGTFTPIKVPLLHHRGSRVPPPAGAKQVEPSH